MEHNQLGGHRSGEESCERQALDDGTEIRGPRPEIAEVIFSDHDRRQTPPSRVTVACLVANAWLDPPARAVWPVGGDRPNYPRHSVIVVCGHA
jgi:hypothetical protein